MKFLKLFQERYFILLAVCIFIASVITFNSFLFQTTFGYDMARDAFEAHSILFDHHLKILGPGTDINGLYHGVLWYYALVIPYFIAHQDPQIAAFIFYFFAIITIPVVWLLSFKLFKDKTISFVSTVLYGFSPFVILLSSWMSNPILCLYATPPLLLLIWSFIEKPKVKKAFLIGIFYGVLIQSQLANAILLITIPLFYLFFKVRIKTKEILSLGAGLFLSLLSYLIVEIKFKGRGISGLMEFLKSHHGGVPKPDDIVNKLLEFFNITVFPFPIFVIVILLIIFVVLLAIYFRKSKRPVTFLLIWLSNILLFTFFNTGVSHSSFVFIPSVAAGVILVGFVFSKLIKNKIVIAITLLIIIFFQIKTVISWQKQEFSPTAIQRSNTVYRYRQVVDYTYKSSFGQPFIITTVTNPLFINTTWAYLYGYYGKQKYGYVPFWGGRGQTGYLGNLPEKQFGTELRYLIIESTIGIPDVYVTKAKYEEEKVSDLIEEKHFGYVVVQKRKFHEGKEKIKIPDDLKNSPVLYE